MSKNVRVRFAPSPTGPLHIGGVRTALFNYLFAKKHNGTFILRIEDTDLSRYVEGAEAYIIETLQWCGIPFDEGPGKEKDNYGPYRQSERQQLYKQYAEALVAGGKAYYAFDTEAELELHRKDGESRGETFIYNRHNRLQLKNSLSLPEEEVKMRMEAGETYVIRFFTPEHETLLLKDIVRGEITIDTDTLDDKVLFKSDGMPTYHLANVVDDHLMEISHVIRGEEWLPSLALHQLLYDAFGWEAPEFAHLPLLLKPSGNGKLSKRDGEKLGFPVFPVEWKDPATGMPLRNYREEGYFPEAIINFLALLGWNPGTTQELFSLEELISAFHLEQVNKSGARFDPEKIKWFNHQYLQTKSDEELAAIFSGQGDHPYFTKVVGLLKDRATFVKDFWVLGDYFFKAPLSYDEKAAKKQWKPETNMIMTNLVAFLETLEKTSSSEMETAVKRWMGDKGLSFREVMPPLRLALVGEMTGPHVFDIAALLGKEETIKRIKEAVKRL